MRSHATFKSRDEGVGLWGTTQLICPNASEFHYPGHAPKHLIRHRLDDIPPGEE
jgi:hypothetical protein